MAISAEERSAALIAATDGVAGNATPGTWITDRTLNRGRWLVIAALAAIGLLASAMLAYDGWRALVDADHELMCSIDPTIDCGPAMGIWQARAFGFPNPYLGLAAFATALTAAMARLAGSRANWFRTGLLAGSIFGQGFVLFLMFTTFTQLPALCPWCTVIWTIIWPMLLLQIVDLLESSGGANGLVRHRWAVMAGGYVLAALIGLLTMGMRVLR
jgi:uncharacterized membrane protein